MKYYYLVKLCSRSDTTLNLLSSFATGFKDRFPVLFFHHPN